MVTTGLLRGPVEFPMLSVEREGQCPGRANWEQARRAGVSRAVPLSMSSVGGSDAELSGCHGQPGPTLQHRDGTLHSRETGAQRLDLAGKTERAPHLSLRARTRVDRQPVPKTGALLPLLSLLVLSLRVSFQRPMYHPSEPSAGMRGFDPAPAPRTARCLGSFRVDQRGGIASYF